jgi:hypothetical protein
MFMLALLPCAADTPCAILQGLERHSVSHPRRKKHRACTLAGDPTRLGGPTTPASIVGGWSKSRPGPIRAAFVRHARVLPYMSGTPYAHRNNPTTWFCTKLAENFSGTKNFSVERFDSAALSNTQYRRQVWYVKYIIPLQGRVREWRCLQSPQPQGPKAKFTHPYPFCRSFTQGSGALGRPIPEFSERRRGA